MSVSFQRGVSGGWEDDDTALVLGSRNTVKSIPSDFVVDDSTTECCPHLSPPATCRMSQDEEIWGSRKIDTGGGWDRCA